MFVIALSLKMQIQCLSKIKKAETTHHKQITCLQVQPEAQKD